MGKWTICSDVFPTQKWGMFQDSMFFFGGTYLYHSPRPFFPKLRPFFIRFVFPKKNRPGLSVRKNLRGRNGTTEGRPPAPEVAKAGVGWKIGCFQEIGWF